MPSKEPCLLSRLSSFCESFTLIIGVDVQIPFFENDLIGESRKRPLTNCQNIFGEFDISTINADGATSIPACLDTMHCDDSPFLQLPNVIDDLEFEFPFNMDTDSVNVGLNVLTDADHTGLVTP